MVRLDFQAESNTVSPADAKTTIGTNAAQQDWLVTIQPMEIRTFVIKVIFDQFHNRQGEKLIHYSLTNKYKYQTNCSFLSSGTFIYKVYNEFDGIKMELNNS